MPTTESKGDDDMALSENSKIKLGLVIVVIATCCTLAATLAGLRSDIENIKSSQWTIAQQCETALRTAILNPGLMVPDPRSPGGIIVVDKAKIVPGPD